MKKLNHLDENAKNLLEKISNLDVLKDFVLVGGSALAIHLGHRISEDLDFFTNIKFDEQKIREEMNIISNSVVLMNKTNNQTDLMIDNTKITFCYQNIEILNKKKCIKDNIYIAEIDAIAVLKILTLFLRAKYRDYYDIYFLCKILGLKELNELGKKNIPNFLTKFFHNALIYIDDIEEENIDYLRPAENITIFQIRDYFVKEIKELNKIYE